MPKTAKHLRVLDQLGPPDLWPDIRGRVPRRPPEQPRGARRVLVAALALAIATAGIAFAVRAFEVAERPARPASTVANGLLAFFGGREIHVVSPDGSGLRQVADTGGDDVLNVRWSPDGSKLAFSVWTKGDYEIFVANADGSDLTNVTGSMGVSHFAWSPDGSRLAFTSFQEGNDIDVFVVNVDGTGLRAIVESPFTEHRPQWSPDGMLIAFERWPVRDRDPGTADIYAVGPEGGEAVPLVTSPGHDTGVAWSPDGARLAFVSDRDGDEEIYVVNADGSGERQLTDLPDASATGAAWSPDGSRLSFVAHDGEQSDVWVVNADGSGLLKLTPSDRDDGPAVWAPDGRLLAFTASEVTGNVDNSGTYDVYTIHPDGTEELRITFGRVAMGWDLSWQPVIVPSASPTADAPSPTPSPSYLPLGERWAPPTYREGDRLVMPVTFPDGTTAELVYPAKLGLEQLSVYPDTYADGGPDVCGYPVSATRYDPLVWWVRGDAPLAEHVRQGGTTVALWQGTRDHEPYDYLVYRFGSWSVLVPCKWDGDEEALAIWAENLHGYESPEGLLVLQGTPPLVLHPWRDQNGPTLRMSDDDVVVDLRPLSGQCDPASGWGGDTDPRDGVVQWCVQPEGAIYIYANGFTSEGKDFLQLLVNGLEVRDVQPAE